MNASLSFLIAFPCIWAVVAFLIWRNRLHIAFIPILIIGSVAITSLIYFSGRWSKTVDYEVWNGQVKGKERNRVSCSHSYSCNCRTRCSSGKNGSCTTTCDTCYEHSYDVNWDVYTTIGNFSISRVDRRGVNEPPRWTVVQAGQPWADTHQFTNYIKAAPFSLFNKSEKELAAALPLVPTYPLKVYDYQYIDRVIPVGVTVPNLSQWNYDLAMTLRDLGPTKQANIIVLFANKDPQYSYVVENAWIGGKKNDIVVIVGVKEYPKIEWVRVLSWTKEELFKVKLRDDLQELGTIEDRVKFLNILHENTMKMFKRRHMSEFKYLESEISPPDWAIVLAAIMSIVGSLGFTFCWIKFDWTSELFGSSYNRWHRFK